MAANDFAAFTGLNQDGLLYLLQLLMADIKAAAPDLTNYVQTDDSRLTDERTPTAHTSDTAKYGGATASLFGHVMLSDTVDTVVGASADSVGASQKAVNDVYKAIPALDTAITSEATATAAASSKAVYDYVKNALANITSFSAQIFETLPETGETNILYLVAKASAGETGNVYDEYLYINGKFELVGSTAMDLSGYVLASDLHALTNSEISAIYANAKAAVNG